MLIYDLIINIFMAMTLVFGASMMTLSIYYRKRLRKIECLGRVFISALMVYSVCMRFALLLPGPFPFVKEVSIGFDIFYIAITIIFSLNILSRKKR